MKILHLLDSFSVGGAERLVVRMANAQAQIGHDVCIGAFSDGPMKEECNVPFVLFQKPPGFSIRFLNSLVRFLKKERINVLHTHMLQADLYGAAAVRISGGKHVLTLHGASIFSKRKGRTLMPLVSKHCTGMVAVSNALADEMRSLGGHAVMIHNGVDLQEISRKMLSKETARKRLGIEEDVLVIGSVGNLRSVKNFPMLISSMSFLVREGINASCIIVGDGVDRDLIERAGANLGVTVYLLGIRSDIPEILSAFDVYACTSEREGISMAILEAMATKLPIVATRVGGNPELVSEGETGFLATRGNSTEFASALKQLALVPSLREKMGRAGRERVEQRFSFSEMISSYESIYSA